MMTINIAAVRPLRTTLLRMGGLLVELADWDDRHVIRVDFKLNRHAGRDGSASVAILPGHVHNDRRFHTIDLHENAKPVRAELRTDETARDTRRGRRFPQMLRPEAGDCLASVRELPPREAAEWGLDAAVAVRA